MTSIKSCTPSFLACFFYHQREISSIEHLYTHKKKLN